MSRNQKFYAYFIINTNENGILENWAECQKKVSGKKARYKSFKSLLEAQEWLNSGANYEKKEKKDLTKLYSELEREAIYFDAGTGRGNGVEVRLTDFDGNSLLYKIMNEKNINEFGNYYVADTRTNNFGELVGIYTAFVYAKKYGTKIICGDSSLVIEYWTKERYNSSNLESDTVELIKKTALMRNEFEKRGGTVKKISGDVNPADLGFHK
ncbi:RNase H1/viroplasmin domain-containing protein [Leptotrichia wadei]|uniref:RNase H1/viroplasmin domain-containing protein n=1 Tax=Leptotrichia wadei TaxID=157687 RepID=UPI00352BFFF3